MKEATKETEGPQNQGHWAPDEHNRFVQAIVQHGKNWKKIVECVGTRSSSQVRSHAQKYFEKLEKKRPKPIFRSKTEVYMMYMQTLGYQAYMRYMMEAQKTILTQFQPDKQPVVVIVGESEEKTNS